MKKTVITLNILLANLIIICDILYITEVPKLFMKGITSALFFLLGIVNLIYCCKSNKENLKFSIFLTFGLFICFIADIILNIHFISGALIFALGHICYIFAYSYISKFNWKDLIPAACIFVPALTIILFVPIFNFGGFLMQFVCIIYALIISAMVGKAISNLLKNKSIYNICILLGSVFFFVSDFMLLFDQFSNLSNIFGIVCLATYYPAQALLGYSIFQKSNEN